MSRRKMKAHPHQARVEESMEGKRNLEFSLSIAATEKEGMEGG
jgi:hypothetical protein